MDLRFEKQNVLVTGGAGFIGSNLIEALMTKNNRVVCLDNFSTGKRENIQGFMTHPNFKLIEGDIRDTDICMKSVEGMDYVFHQAALGSVPRSIYDPITTTDVNIGGFVKMLFAAKEKKVKRFIYAASSSTYGDHPGMPKVEDQIGKPLSPYAITKYANELYAENFSTIYGMETIGLRYFNVFGKRQDPHGAYAAVIPLFIKKLIHHESPIINGNGEHSRDFTYIENVIQANILAATVTEPKAIDQVFNVAYGENNNLNQLVEYLKFYLSEFDPEIKKVNSTYGPERKGDVKHSLASIEKAKTLLGYRPAYSLKDGLRKAIEWYWENLR